MKILITAFLFLSIVAQAGQIGDRRISGVVKSFDDKSVKVESGGKLFEFDIDRVIDRLIQILETFKPNRNV